MFTKLAQVRERYLALRRQLEDGSVYADPALAARLLKEQKELQPVAETYALWERARADQPTRMTAKSRCVRRTVPWPRRVVTDTSVSGTTASCSFARRTAAASGAAAAADAASANSANRRRTDLVWIMRSS